MEADEKFRLAEAGKYHFLHLLKAEVKMFLLQMVEVEKSHRQRAAEQIQMCRRVVVEKCLPRVAEMFPLSVG
jgi:hypothetical protein